MSIRLRPSISVCGVVRCYRPRASHALRIAYSAFHGKVARANAGQVIVAPLTMNQPEQLKAQIQDAFAEVQHPGDWCLRGSNEGDEPFLLEQEFKGKSDWRMLDAAFIDQAPSGLGSALSFFSDEAFRFYLPAYLIASIDNLLEQSDPVFHLCHGLDDASRNEKVNPRRYGERTWCDEAELKFAMLTKLQSAAIVAYLRFVRGRDEFDAYMIDQALNNYWLDRG